MTSHKTKLMKSVMQDMRNENHGLSVTNDPQQMTRGVFTGIGTAASGETVYLKMALITEENQADWMEYIRRSKAMSGLGTLAYLANNTHQTTGEDGHTSYEFKDKDDRTFLPRAGFIAEEFNDFINYLGQKGFTAAVAQKFFPEKKYMRVRPIGSMQAIISNSSLKREDFHNDDESYDKIKAVTNCREEDGETATNSINTSALANLYYQSSAKMEKRAITSDELKVADEVRMRF